MVICRYFQQGSCRFGTKCNNEHFDIKQILKADVEAAVNGKMWPFSSYGPFKDKPSIPNFIEDQSFEEMRLLCYTSKSQNYFEQFHQQFNKEVVEATNKLKALVQVTPQIMDLVMKVYDTADGAQPPAANNPFSMTGATGTAPPASSIFGKPAVGTGNIFGSVPNNTFSVQPSTAGSNIFGGVNVGTSTTSNIFGGSASGPIGSAGNSNMFTQQAQQQTSIFAQQTPVQPSIFGQQPQQKAFGQQPTNQPFGGGNIFAQPQQPTNPNPFGQSSMVTNSGFEQQQQQQTNIFAQAAATVPNTGSMFPQPVQQPQQQQQQHTGFFGQPAYQQTQVQPQAQPANPPAAQPQPTQVDCKLYSRLESLSADDIEAFKADLFLPGKLPLVPPPRELIN